MFVYKCRERIWDSPLGLGALFLRSLNAAPDCRASSKLSITPVSSFSEKSRKKKNEWVLEDRRRGKETKSDKVQFVLVVSFAIRIATIWNLEWQANISYVYHKLQQYSRVKCPLYDGTSSKQIQ